MRESSTLCDSIGHIDPRLAAQINQAPGSFYFNVHTKEFPQGAVRGQLFRAG